MGEGATGVVRSGVTEDESIAAVEKLVREVSEREVGESNVGERSVRD